MWRPQLAAKCDWTRWNEEDVRGLGGSQCKGDKCGQGGPGCHETGEAVSHDPSATPGQSDREVNA